MTVLVGISKNNCTRSEESESEQLHREPRYNDSGNIHEDESQIRVKGREREPRKKGKKLHPASI